ncbi:unnamed protein product, partial [Arabidopsis lyrata]
KNDESQESVFKDATGVCLPLINATIRDLEKEGFPKDCSLNMEIPTSPSYNKCFKVTKQNMWRQSLSWQAVSAHRDRVLAGSEGPRLVNSTMMFRYLAISGKAHRFTTQKKSIVEIESVGVAGKTDQGILSLKELNNKQTRRC